MPAATVRSVLRWGGWALLWGGAVAGLILSAGALLALLPATRPWIASVLVRQVDEAVAGRLELEGIAVLPHGGVELSGLRVLDPEGAQVLRVERARVFVDELGIAARVVGLSAELEGVEADAARRDADGELAIARAFAPARPRAKRAPAPEEEPAPAERRGAGGWAVRVGRLSIGGGRILAEGSGGEPLDASGVTLEARGLWAPHAAWIEARIGGALAAPLEAPLSVELRASRGGDRVELQRLSVALGRDRLEAVGEGDLARRTGRVAVTRLGLSAREAGALAPAARLGGELAGTFYAESSDGAVATAALEVTSGTAGGAGSARIAAAARLPPAALAWGILGEVDRLDPSRLTRLAPPGRVTLRARGASRGTRLADLTGRIDLRLERSRLRGGELGPAQLQATARGGSVDVTRLELAAPGGSISGALRWREGSEVSGRLQLVAGSLETLEANLAAALGRPVTHLEGSGRADVTLSGRSAAPRLEARVDATRLGVGRVRCEGARLSVDVRGPAATVEGRVKGGLRAARVGALELRGVELDAVVGAEEGSLSFTASAPRLGSELVRAMLRGSFGPRRATFDLADAAFAWPGIRFELQRPARIGLEVPSVDRLILAAGSQRIELTGGFDRGGRLDARLRLGDLDLARLPTGLVPGAQLAGLLTVDARASGTRGAPRVDATLGLTGGAAFEVGGLQLLGNLAWDGEADRIEADLGLVRERGGAVDLSFDLPTALGRARRGEELRLELHGRAVPLDELVWLAGSPALVSGDVDLTATLGGTVEAPSLRGTVAVREGTWDDLEGLGLDATVEAPGERLRVRASGALAGGGVAGAEAEVALDLSALLARPREVAAGLRRAPGTLTVRAPALALAPLAGRLELPDDVAGRLEAEAALGGSLAAPRGTVRVALEEGAGWGAREVGGRLDVALAPERTGARLELLLAGATAARADAALELPAERLLDRAALAGAPLRADVSLPRSALAAWGGEIVTLGGTIEGRGAVHGTLAAPQAEVALTAADATVAGRPLGAVSFSGRYAARRATLSVDLRPPAGGTLHADGALDRPLGLGAAAGQLRSAPAELRISAENLALGFLPALAPGVVRVASGAVTLELAAAGPLAELRPKGRFTVAGGRLGIAELGEWTDASIEADLGEEAVKLARFDVRKGKGKLSVRGALRWPAKRGEPGELEATIESDDFGLERAGMEFAKLDLSAEVRGQAGLDGLTLGVVVPRAEVKLPRRIPRSLQEIEVRKDITVGRPKPVRARRPAREAPAAAEVGEGAGAPRGPFKTVLHVVAPRRLRVRADQPRIDVELKADALFAFAGSRQEATGWIETIRGQVEPIGGRVFELERGKVTFTGGPIRAGVLDLAARYDNPAHKVRATVEGTLARPKLHLSAEPPLSEAQIAMLVATGRTEVKAGTGGVNSLAPSDAGLAAAGAVVMGAFKELLSDKLPVDSVSLDSTAVAAGKYLTDRIYVGYVRRFDAKPEKGENPDEVRFEYQLAPGWQVETRYGSGQSGGASIVWTRNY